MKSEHSIYPAQLERSHMVDPKDGWMNKIFWGDNLTGYGAFTYRILWEK